MHKCWRFEDAMPQFCAVEERLDRQCRQETDHASTIFVREDRNASRLLLQRENNNLKIVRAFCDLKQQAIKEEMDTLKMTIATKEREQDQLGQERDGQK